MKITVVNYWKRAIGDEVTFRFQVGKDDVVEATIFDEREYLDCAQEVKERLNTTYDVQKIAGAIEELHARCRDLQERAGGFSVEVIAYWRYEKFASVYFVIRNASQYVIYENAVAPAHDFYCRQVAADAEKQTKIDRKFLIGAFKQIQTRCEQLSIVCEA